MAPRLVNILRPIQDITSVCPEPRRAPSRSAITCTARQPSPALASPPPPPPQPPITKIERYRSCAVAVLAGNVLPAPAREREPAGREGAGGGGAGGGETGEARQERHRAERFTRAERNILNRIVGLKTRSCFFTGVFKGTKI